MDLEHQQLSEYREFPVPAALADRLLCLWTHTITGSQGVYQQRVLPDACIDLVLINGQPGVWQAHGPFPLWPDWPWGLPLPGRGCTLAAHPACWVFPPQNCSTR
jgi:hypothetical protein